MKFILNEDFLLMFLELFISNFLELLKNYKEISTLKFKPNRVVIFLLQLLFTFTMSILISLCFAKLILNILSRIKIFLYLKIYFRYFIRKTTSF
jgi:hypothetical protein